MRYLVTGTAGFIGFHLAKRLLDEGHEVIGIDGFTEYYGTQIKEDRHALLAQRNGYTGYRAMLEDQPEIAAIWTRHSVDRVVHLAAQAGVRYSLENPRAYIDANVIGTFNLLELARHHPVEHVMLASTSSVYGANADIPFRETDKTVTPMTLYAATKMATEQMAHCYSHLWQRPMTAFRFFSVYGPWGRPDMALFLFTRNIFAGQPIDVFNHGNMLRDFTYVDDLVDSIYKLSFEAPRVGEPRGDADTLSPVAPYRTVNIGGGHPVTLIEFIEAIERWTGKSSIRNYMEMQPGDVPRTFASADLLKTLTGSAPSTPVTVGVKAFVDWYRDYHKV